MGVEWLLVCHGLVTAVVVVSFLCGRWPIFEGTFIQRIHYFLTFGAYDYFLYLSLSLFSIFASSISITSSLSFAGVSLALFSVLSVRIRFSPSNITAAIVPILFCRYYNILLFRSIAPTCAINFNVLKLFFLCRCYNLSALSIVYCEL